MNLLVIDDDENKRTRLAEFVMSAYPGVSLTVRNSYQSGLAQALRHPPDVVLLDMSMPTFDVTAKERGGEVRPFAGRDILRELDRKGVQTRIVVVTQFESFGEGSERKTLAELRDELSRRFSPLYVGAVAYQPSEATWQEKLKAAISKALK